MIRGTVVKIGHRIAGSELSVGATAGAPQLFVTSAADFDPDGGQLQLPDGSVLTYQSAESGGGVEQINVTSPGVFPEESRIDVYPRLEEYYADVLQDDVEDVPIRALVPRQLMHYLAEGTYDQGASPRVLLDELGTSFVVNQVLYQGDPNAPGFIVRGLGGSTIDPNLVVFEVDDSAGTLLFRIDNLGSALAEGGRWDWVNPGDGTAWLRIDQAAHQIRFGDGSGAPVAGLHADGAAQRVKTDQQLVAGDGLITIVVGHHVSDSDFAQTPINGMLAVDTTGRLYFRYGGNWHYCVQDG